MIKNKSFKIFGITAICLIFGVAIYLNFIPQQLTETVIDPALIPAKELLIDLQQNKQLSTEEKIEKTKEILDKLPPEYEKLKRQYQIAMSTLPDIKFYGRVVDQYGQPVSGASVGYIGTNAYLSAGGGRGKVMTDQDGYFEIDTVGATLNLGGVVHPDIEYSHQLDNGIGREIPQERLKLVKRFLSHDDNSGIYANWHNYTEKNKAYVIQAWRLGEYEGATEGTLSVYPNLDGRQYTIDLLGKNYKSQVKEGLNKGHLVINCIRKTMSSLRDYGDWAVTIAPVNGGIQIATDPFMNEAPATGYQSSLIINMKQGATDYHSSLLNQRYYFTANNDKTYGSLFVRFDPHRNYKRDRCGIEISHYKINTTGSRNLELKQQPMSKIEPSSTIQTTYAYATN